MKSHVKSRARYEKRALLFALTLATIALLGALGHQYFQTRGTAAYQCLTEIPTGVAQTEQALVYSRVSAWPIGRACTWLMSDGNLITLQSEWTATVVATVATAICVIVAGVFAYFASQPDRRHLWWYFAWAVSAPAITWFILVAAAATFVYSAALA